MDAEDQQIPTTSETGVTPAPSPRFKYPQPLIIMPEPFLLLVATATFYESFESRKIAKKNRSKGSVSKTFPDAHSRTSFTRFELF